MYFQLEKMLLELRLKLKKEDLAVLVKGSKELYNKAKEALETALGRSLKAEEEIARAVD